MSVPSSSYGELGAYNLKVSPSIFVLDRNKTIVSRRIGADQLLQVITMLQDREGAGD